MRAQFVVLSLFAFSTAALAQLPPPPPLSPSKYGPMLFPDGRGEPAIGVFAPPAGPEIPAPLGAQELPAPRPVGKKVVFQDDPILKLVEFRDIPLQDASRLLSQQSGLRIVPSAEAAKTKVSLFLTDVSASTAINAIAQANGLIVRRDGEAGIIRIHTAKENQRDLASFRDEQTRVFTLLYPNAISVATAIRDLYGTRVLLGYGPTIGLNYQDLQQSFQRFDLLYSRSLGIGTLNGVGVGGVGTGLGGGGFGGTGFGGVGTGFGGVGGFGTGGGGFGGGLGQGGLGGGFGNTFGGFGGINQNFMQGQRQQDNAPDLRLKDLTPEEIQDLENVLETKGPIDRSQITDIIRRQPTTIFVTVIKANNQIVVRTSDPAIMANIEEIVCKLDVPTPAVLLEVKILAIDLKDDFTSSFDFQFTNAHLTAGSFTAGNILPPAADALSSAARRQTSIAPGPLGALPPRDFVFQIVSDNFRARLQLLEDKKRITEVATPILLTTNNEVSQIFTGRQIPITVGFTPSQIVSTTIANSNTLASTPITQLQNIGSTLLITPNINADRTVTLRVQQENSRVIPDGATIPLPSNNGNTVNQVPIDVVQRQSLTGTFVAKDGLTIAVGGLIEEGISDSRQQIPVLGRLPYVGFFFRSQETIRFRRELVILIRPYVLSTPQEGSPVSRHVAETLSYNPQIQAGQLDNLGSFTPAEVLRPNPPITDHQKLFRVHMVQPKDY